MHESNANELDSAQAGAVSNSPALAAARQLASSYQLLQQKVAQLVKELDEVQAQKAIELEQRRQLTHRMQALLEFLPGGVIVLDAKGVVVESNPAACNMLNSTLNGKTWRSLISACFSPRTDDGMDISTIDGRRVHLATASLEDHGQIILLTDQTETRRLQDKVNRHERLTAMGKMVSALAHQIRTPLTAAILYANHLCSDQIAPERRRIFTAKLKGRLEHMAEQVKDMLLFVRNELPLNDVVSLGDLERGLKAAMEVPMHTSRSRCIWENPNSNVEIRCNREALISALLNLINNAIQACGTGARLKVSFIKTALNGDAAVAIAIADNGPGMDGEQLKAVKEIFYTTKPQGTGLGLAVVQSVARAHGGSFRLQSKLGRGTCGVLTLPLVEAIGTVRSQVANLQRG